MMNSPSTLPELHPFQRAERIAAMGISEILRIGAEATERRRQGHPVVALGAGEPDFDTPDHVKEAAIRAIQAGEAKYTPLEGTGSFKAAIAHKLSHETSLIYTQPEIIACAGAKQVIYNAFMATLNPGDEVIITAPYWTSYIDMISIAGGVPRVVACSEANGFRVEAAALEAAITPRTRWLLLNSPSNPSGAAYSAAQLQPLLDVLLRHPHVWLMSDDIYEHLIYDDQPFVSAVHLAPALRYRKILVIEVSNAYDMTGRHLGYGAGPRLLISAIHTVQNQSTSNPSSVSQAAAIAALTGDQAIVAERRALFQQRRDIIVDRLNQIDGIVCRQPEGAFYTFSSCAGLIGRTTPQGKVIDSDMAFCR